MQILASKRLTHMHITTDFLQLSSCKRGSISIMQKMLVWVLLAEMLPTMALVPVLCRFFGGINKTRDVQAAI